MATSRSQKFVSCIQEMEATEEILNRKWQQIQACGPSRSKSSIEKLLIKLTDRQSTTSAALQALDSYERLKGERSDFRSRREAVLIAFRHWLSHVEAESGGSGSEGELDNDEKEVMRKYAEYRKISQTFAKKWTHFRKSDKKVTKELKGLNSCFSKFPQRLSSIKVERLASVNWPTSQCQKLSAAVDLAFDQIDFMTKLLNEIDDKLESLEVFFRINQSSLDLENREGAYQPDEEDFEFQSDQSEEEMEDN